MSTASDSVAGFRTHWASRFVDTADIVRLADAADRGAINPTTLLYPAETLTPIETGVACLIRPLTPSAAPTTTDFGQQEVTVLDYAVFFPHDTTGLKLEDRILPQTSVHDPELVGTALRIARITFDSYRTRMMTVCTLDLGGGEQG